MIGTSRGSRRIVRFTLLSAALALSACVTVVQQQPVHVPPQPRVDLVPAVEGLTLGHARAELEAAGYRLGRVTKEWDRHAPPASVLWQEPEPHTPAPLGSPVDLVIAAKHLPGVAPPPQRPDLTSVPDLGGLELRQVRRALRRADLRLGDVSEGDARNAVPGTVIWQGPAARRRVEPGSVVNLVLARRQPDRPVARTTVPKLRGLGLDEARARLSQARLHLGQVAEQVDNSARRGTVIAQNPDPRREVRPGTAVDVVLARRQPGQPVGRPKPGQPAAGVTVPKLRGLTVKEARARLRRVELQLGQITEQAGNDARRGTVIRQHPKPGQDARPGSAVDIMIAGNGPGQPTAKTTVPKLRGLPLKKAHARLKKAQLRLGEVTEQADNSARKGTVIAQDPDPRREVHPGTAVDLVVAAATEPNQQLSGIKVPDLRGQNAAAATALLERSGLQVGQLLAQKKGKGLPGTVLNQDPQPGAVVQRGASIDLVVLLRAER